MPVQVRMNLLLKSFDGKPVANAYKVSDVLLPAFSFLDILDSYNRNKRE